MNNEIKILYVDDEEFNIKLFELNFSKLYNVLTAYSGMEGIEIINSNQDIEFIISDMKMPEMNGLEFINEVKKIKKDIPCMILSGYCETPEITEALNSNTIVDYMIKPFKVKTLSDVINKNIKA